MPEKDDAEGKRDYPFDVFWQVPAAMLACVAASVGAIAGLIAAGFMKGFRMSAAWVEKNMVM